MTKFPNLDWKIHSVIRIIEISKSFPELVLILKWDKEILPIRIDFSIKISTLDLLINNNPRYFLLNSKIKQKITLNTSLIIVLILIFKF